MPPPQKTLLYCLFIDLYTIIIHNLKYTVNMLGENIFIIYFFNPPPVLRTTPSKGGTVYSPLGGELKKHRHKSSPPAEGWRNAGVGLPHLPLRVSVFAVATPRQAPSKWEYKQGFGNEVHRNRCGIHADTKCRVNTRIHN